MKHNGKKLLLHTNQYGH